MSHHYNGTTMLHMTSVRLFTPDEVFAALELHATSSEKPSKYVQLEKFRIKAVSQRLEVFWKKGLTCHSCERQANIFSMERPTCFPQETPHLNLYALEEEERFVQFTKDHIIPRSLGGPDRLENFVTMCSKCNSKKSNSLPKRDEAEAVIAELQENGYKFKREINLPYDRNPLLVLADV